VATELPKIERGDLVVAHAADGRDRTLRALGGPMAGGDFGVVWACSLAEWDRAEAEGRSPSGIPWPLDDVRLASGGTE
jgi:hypothetical protein